MRRITAWLTATVALLVLPHAAGVGVGTVYRRFPDLQALIDELFADRFTTFQQLAEAAAREPDPGAGLRRAANDDRYARYFRSPGLPVCVLVPAPLSPAFPVTPFWLASLLSHSAATVTTAITQAVTGRIRVLLSIGLVHR